MARHRVFIETGAGTGLGVGPLVIGGDEAHHAARVKRLAPGDAVEVLDGRGGVGRARLAAVSKERGEWVVRLEVEGVEHREPARPRVEVWTAVPKGPRLLEMIDGLSEAGAAEWRALDTERGVASAGAHKLEKVERHALEASKQCGRAWVMHVGAPASLAEGLRAGDPGAGARVIVADASGARYAGRGEGTVRVLIGPEGGWSERELAAARAAGAGVVAFGPHTMRIETAAVVGAAVVMAGGS
jgi:16S rRNA (uracil1498-N3)-methyltransferase